MKANQPQVTSFAQPKMRRRGVGCLIWGMVASLCLFVAGVIVIASTYAGWNAGVETARANAAGTVEVDVQQQCDRIPLDLSEGNLNQAQTRIEWLQRATPAPTCLLGFASTATAAFLRAQPSPTLIPSATATLAAPTAPPPVEPPPTEIDSGSDWEYDLDALLADAVADLESRDYLGAIDTLEAIISIDKDFQRDAVSRMVLDALTSHALALYRSGKLSEAIVLTERAEVYGDIGELNYERYVADLYLAGQRYKVSNPALAVLRFNEIVNQHNRNYMNGQVVGELQDALRYYGDALALQGDACLALDQFAAALELQPSYSPVSRAEIAAKQQQAALACGSQAVESVGNGGIGTGGTPQPVGVPVAATRAPVGQAG